MECIPVSEGDGRVLKESADGGNRRCDTSNCGII